MALVMRATTQVNEAQAPEENKDFTDKVGKTTYTNFAAPMDEYSYINTSNGLNEKSFSSTMTKGEYIALVTNYLRANYLAEIKANGYVDNYSDTCESYICKGQCKKGREADHNGYCQKCGKYKPRIRKKHINKKKQALEKIRKNERD